MCAALLGLILVCARPSFRPIGTGSIRRSPQAFRRGTTRAIWRDQKHIEVTRRLLLQLEQLQRTFSSLALSCSAIVRGGGLHPSALLDAFWPTQTKQETPDHPSPDEAELGAHLLKLDTESSNAAAPRLPALIDPVSRLGSRFASPRIHGCCKSAEYNVGANLPRTIRSSDLLGPRASRRNGVAGADLESLPCLIAFSRFALIAGGTPAVPANRLTVHQKLIP